MQANQVSNWRPLKIGRLKFYIMPNKRSAKSGSGPKKSPSDNYHSIDRQDLDWSSGKKLAQISRVKMERRSLKCVILSMLMIKILSTHAVDCAKFSSQQEQIFSGKSIIIDLHRKSSVASRAGPTKRVPILPAKPLTCASQSC